MRALDWSCPSCGLSTEVAADRVQRSVTTVMSENAVGPRLFALSAVVCPNRLCMQLSVTMAMHALRKDAHGSVAADERPLRSWDLVPGPKGRQLPNYVPDAVSAEYAQACQILDISPSAAALLARRCLQGMVRDFWGVKKTFLADELDGIEDKVDRETWEAIEAVRRRGSIAKHFEKGTNVLIEVDRGEPEALLRLIEYLVEDWYVARRRRQQRLAEIKRDGASGAD
ncbi:MAG: DUF4145 domain-containing protein [Myxococcales bacterium]|nr:DUF4145 domain-containing protein [Myxococcales bacterium]